MTTFLEQVSAWCTDEGMGVRPTEDEALEVDTTSGNPVVLSHSVDRLWLQQRLDVPDPTGDAAAIAACRLANLARRGILNARWRVGFVEITGSIQQDDCTRQSLAWLIDEAASIADLITRQLDPT